MTRDEINVLVVDDVASMRVRLTEVLKSIGFRNISAASSGEEAKQVMESATTKAPGAFHLILADWLMAPGSGIDVLHFARGHPMYQNAAFVLVTAENTKEKVMEAVQAGVDGYIVKPLTPDSVESKVVGVLIKRKIIG
jgi:two-component system chemotaxis response regulator CheY